VRCVAPTHEIVGQVVEGGTEVGEHVAGNDAPFGGKRLNAFDVEGKTVTLGIVLFPEPVRWFGVKVGPSPDVILESVKVMLCPIELAPTAFVEGAHGAQNSCVIIGKSYEPSSENTSRTEGQQWV
jgi:hypothetical protein